MFEHICRTCLIHHKPTCQPEEMLCFTCSSDEVPGELLLFYSRQCVVQACEIVPTTAEHHRISKAKASFCSRPFQASPLSAKLCLLFLPPLPQSVGLAIFCRSSRWRSFALLSPLGNFGDVSGAAINLLWWRRSGGA